MIGGGDPSRLKIVNPEENFRAGEPSHLTVGGTIHPLSPILGATDMKINLIKFEPGARFRPHGHPFDQILYYEYGTGLVAVDGGPDMIVPTRHFVLLPANVVHMHGCTDDGPALQLSLMHDTQTTFDVTCPESWLHWLADKNAKGPA